MLIHTALDTLYILSRLLILVRLLDVAVKYSTVQIHYLDVAGIKNLISLKLT